MMNGMADSSKTWTWEFEDELLRGDLIKKFEGCLQCGKCVGACPAATVSSHYNVRKIIRDMMYGKMDDLMKSVEIWECFLCNNCEVLCPQDEKIPNLIQVLRHEALSRGYGHDLIINLHPLTESLLETGSIFRNKKISSLRERLGLEPIRPISSKTVQAIQKLCDESSFAKLANELEPLAKKSKKRVFIY